MPFSVYRMTADRPPPAGIRSPVAAEACGITAVAASSAAPVTATRRSIGRVLRCNMPPK